MGGIQVDERGWRFANETLFPGGLGAKMLDLPGKHSYEIFDEYIYQAAQDRLAKVAEAGILEKADTADELGSRLGVDPIALARTIERYNNCAGGGVDEFGRTVLAPLGLPLFGIEVWVAMYHTQGGLKVNTNAQVLRPDGSLVPNLYAGGGTASGISGSGADGYFPGNGLLAALGLGKLAGEHAAGCVAVGT
jgi:fumarate reductase flavoprotein subunit